MASKRPPTCGYTLDGQTCRKSGDHHCGPRVAHVAAFFEEVLMHTKARWSRHPFTLAAWQRNDIIAPLFGTVKWSPEAGRYVRRYRIAWIEVARKNGKALAVDTPILTGAGWSTMGDLRPGDTVHAPDGSLTPVVWVSERQTRPTYRVRFADGAELVASDEHKWTVNDRRLSMSRCVTTAELAETLTCGARGDRRYTVDVPDALDRPDVDLPLDPYLLGAWLGDGTSRRGEITTADPEIVGAFAAAGYAYSYRYERGTAATYGLPGLVTVLRKLGVLGDKHVPEEYLLGSERQRLELLRGLMDTDGNANRGPNTPRAEFTSTSRPLAEAVLFLARSLGWKPTMRESRASIGGRDCGPKWRVMFTAWRDRSPFRLARKTSVLAAAAGQTRAKTNAIVAVDPVDPVEAVCIAVEHPSHQFLAGRSLTPTHNSELLAGIVLYLLVADGEEGAELYGCARDRDQARAVFDVAERMVILSPILNRRLKINKQQKRIADERTGSFYEIIAADAGGNLGKNPHGIAFDEVLTQPNGDLWDALRSAMGTRDQPLLVAATTAGNDPESFAKAEHDEMARILEDPARSPHTFVYIRNVPKGADPWDESLWPEGNPALGDFLSIEALREEALEARNDRRKENAFRQYRLNQWVQQVTRYLALDLWDENEGEIAPNPEWWVEQYRGQKCWAGLDLSSKLDLTAWSLLFEDGTVMWRFWAPESVVPLLDENTAGNFSQWVRGGWVDITEGDVIDYQRIYAAIEQDAERYVIASATYDVWGGEAARQEIENRTNIPMLESQTTYDRMSQPMNELVRMLKAHEMRHGGNPVARWMADCLEAKSPRDDPDRVRPVKPQRGKSGRRIDGMVSLLFAIDGRMALDESLPAAEIF